jgi:HAD superfamily hydrolase (TIGR01484 family)
MPTPLKEAYGLDWPRSIRLLASDMDGTMTANGKFSPELISSLERLRRHGIKVILITGRSAGWVSGLAAMLPISGAVAENGGIFFEPTETSRGRELTSMPHGVAQHRAALQAMFERLQANHPIIHEAPDNRFRITDWTYSVEGLDGPTLAGMARLCDEQGFDFTYSNVQCHILPRGQNKAQALLRLTRDLPDFRFSTNEMVTLGDSPNDETMFDAALFPHSIGVANVLRYSQTIRHLPTYVTAGAEVAGFVETAEFLIGCSTII